MLFINKKINPDYCYQSIPVLYLSYLGTLQTMKKILIIGAGQSGLQLALGLQAEGYAVTIISNRTADEIRNGSVLSTQCLFNTALRFEQAQGLDYWAEEAINIEGVGISVGDSQGDRIINWTGKLNGYAQSVDQRLKMAHWLNLFTERGGELIIQEATTKTLTTLAPHFDLTLVASGKSELANLFEHNTDLSVFTSPQRALAVAYVHGMEPRDSNDVETIRCSLLPGLGELFVIPAHTHSGRCDILFWEGIPGGPLDVFSNITEPAQHLELTLELMKKFTPWEYSQATKVQLTDQKAVLAGRFTPRVRHPIAQVGDNCFVLGLADTIVTNDPITGQGANNAVKCAAIYLDAILQHGDSPFDRQFMYATFERYWNDCRHATKWTNTMLFPPQQHVFKLFEAAGQHQAIADRFANSFDNPADLENWFFDSSKANAFLAKFESNSIAPIE